MAEELTATIADYLPEKKVEAMRDKNSHYGMVYLKAINEQVQSSRNSKLEAKRIKLLKEIEQLHPLLAKKIVAATVYQFFAQFDN
ncbi:hypothetical protein TSACC_3291 [Terrimicrobium sacchariphilum]|uniref:Uncharacterized protein n=1 Tax=Terrimicrobium sacchariphilum TaxID=690879 RepID=A0A146GF15_TERSA|nr:hypothetical protein [Terrimicrobium sacchariphilum]GAT35227.1 hypothetical protein TSACC_3291 [Terrimicrobium sacchariphilum]